MTPLTYENVLKNAELKAYINKGNDILGVLGYTDHSEAHTIKVAETAGLILRELSYPERVIEMTKIAGYMHDLGNIVNRDRHALTGAVLAFQILSRMDAPPEEIADIVSAIGNHDEENGEPVNPMTAALIIADKSDVRRSRVRNSNNLTFDIHDRVNYAVESMELLANGRNREITLALGIDAMICPVIEYFEIFLARMLMCKKAAEFLETNFRLTINGAAIL